jgi:hypothetical protein
VLTDSLHSNGCFSGITVLAEEIGHSINAKVPYNTSREKRSLKSKCAEGEKSR